MNKERELMSALAIGAYLGAAMSDLERTPYRKPKARRAGKAGRVRRQKNKTARKARATNRKRGS